MGEGLRVSIDGPVARITLEQPPLNILTTALMRDLADALDTASASEGVRIVRLDAKGKVFSAGVDVKEHVGEALKPMMDSLAALFEALDRVPVPTVAVVHGAALGGGCELALGTDLCLASEAASFGLPEIRLAVFAPPASVLLPRIVGERRALGMLLSGETVSAAEAERIGLVNQVYPADRFHRQVDECLGRLLELSGAALRHAKRAVVLARSRSQADAHRELIRLYQDELMRTEDAQEGLRAFLEKRTPTWRHR